MLESAAPVLATVNGDNNITSRLIVAVMGGSRNKVSVCSERCIGQPGWHRGAGD